MLAIDAARSSGFRDSLYYFRRNLLALKLNATQIEKDHLIAEGKLGSHLRTRSVTLVTARSAFKLHGSKMVIGKPLIFPTIKIIHNQLYSIRWEMGHR
jgi:chromatin structure-remodeling complex protein RSC7